MEQCQYGLQGHFPTEDHSVVAYAMKACSLQQKVLQQKSLYAFPFCCETDENKTILSHDEKFIIASTIIILYYLVIGWSPKKLNQTKGTLCKLPD